MTESPTLCVTGIRAAGIRAPGVCMAGIRMASVRVAGVANVNRRGVPVLQQQRVDSRWAGLGS